MTFREFLSLQEVGMNPLGGPTASGATGMNFWKGANLSAGNSFQTTGPVMPSDQYKQQVKPKSIPPGPFSMVVGKEGPEAKTGGKQGAFSRTQEKPLVARPASKNSPRGAGATWAPAQHSPFASAAPGTGNRQ